jgi:hypothetical protein
MAGFANQYEFNDPKSRMRAAGADLNPNRAIVDPRGQVLAYAQTGGILGPLRFELERGAKMFRFGAAGRPARDVAAGGWWVEQSQFDKLLSFAQTYDVALGIAVRLLCLVPPEWSDLGLLVRARVVRPLLAWRGLANSVVIAPTAKNSAVRLPHQNDIAERRLAQLYVPGLDSPAIASTAIQIENDYALDTAAGLRGFLYL